MADNNTKAAGKKESFFSGVKKEWSKIIWLTKEDIIKQMGGLDSLKYDVMMNKTIEKLKELNKA